MSTTQPPGGEEDSFWQNYECELDREFNFDGVAAGWAPTTRGIRVWDEEDEYFDVPGNDPLGTRFATSALALSPDERYLAVASNTVIRLFDLEVLEMTAELTAHRLNVSFLTFQPSLPQSSQNGQARYHLLSQTMSSPDHSTIYKSTFNSKGQTLSHKVLVDGTLPSFRSTIWHPAHELILYVDKPGTTQNALRPASELPQVVVFDTTTEKEIRRLQGHTDYIPWAAWSPDGALVATASWDRTYGLWNAHNGLRRHRIGPSKAQNWCGAFLGDGLRMLLCGGPPHKLAIFNVQTAEPIAFLQPPQDIHLDRMSRYFAVHPSRDLVIVQAGRKLFAWEPFELPSSSQSSCSVLLALHEDEEWAKNRYGVVNNIRWVDKGRKLVAQGEDHTIFVWEPAKAWKWRFQRQKGRAVQHDTEPDVLYLHRREAEWILSKNGDRIRLWKL